MKLVCPHCAKVIELSDSLAGQTTTCTLCQGPLTVPFAPVAEVPPASVPAAGPPKQPAPLPPPPPPLPTPDPLGTTTAWQPPASSGTVIPPLPTPAAPSGGGRGAEILGKLQQFQLPPGYEQWVGLCALVLLFLLFLFPWVTVSVGENKIVEQSGVAVGFGSGFATEKEGKFLTTGLPSAGLVAIAFLCALLGLLLVAVILVEKLVHAPAVQNVKPTLQRIAALRDVLVLGFLAVITVVLLLHYFISFPLEAAAATDKEKANSTMLAGLQLVSTGVDSVKTADMVGLQWLKRRGWYSLALLISLVATGWCAVRWMGAKGYTSHWPRLMLQWPGQDGKVS